ncbi:ABC transporter ATP-binding protein [Actinomyces culturomici]|uniref:ABC transporter ATP-binding protein n=1 Tax=Actinomyces culturomici TaxID=1926276 RepID=UPI000E1FB5F2|nr:ABC transporter ATP-binding protein [Actinomyces culturomici]
MSLGPAPVRLVGVSHGYGAGNTRVQALKSVDLEVGVGELVAIMGPSGSGKSTFLAIAGGLERPDEGAVLIHGADISTLDAAERAAVRRRSIGYVFQDFNLIPTLTALENVAMPLELDGAPGKKARLAARAALEEAGASDIADRFPDGLSGGEQQRIAIARALVGRRSIIMADEPTGALDSNSGEKVMLALRNRIDSGVAGILVTHEARFAAWADRTVFLRDGRIIDSSRSDRVEDLL